MSEQRVPYVTPKTFTPAPFGLPDLSPAEWAAIETRIRQLRNCGQKFVMLDLSQTPIKVMTVNAG